MWREEDGEKVENSNDNYEDDTRQPLSLHARASTAKPGDFQICVFHYLLRELKSKRKLDEVVFSKLHLKVNIAILKSLTHWFCCMLHHFYGELWKLEEEK